MNLDTIGIASSSGNGEENNDSGNNSNDGSASDVNDSFNAIITALKDLQSKYQTSQSAEAKVAALQQEGDFLFGLGSPGAGVEVGGVVAAQTNLISGDVLAVG